MNDVEVIASAVLVILGIVVVILKLKIDPVIALVAGALVLALANGLAPADAIETVIVGFGDLMAEVGLLIAFGVLTGTLLTYLGAIQKLVALLLRRFGAKLLPYTFGIAMGTVLVSIFVDVCLVLTAPLARGVAPKVGKHGIARMATALMIGVEVGLTMTIPGVAALALSGLLNVPAGTMLVFGVPVAILTIITAIFVMSMLFRMGFWNPKLDEISLAEKADAANARADLIDPPSRNGAVDVEDPDADGFRGDTYRGSAPTGTAGPRPVPGTGQRVSTVSQDVPALGADMDQAMGSVVLAEHRRPNGLLAFAPLLFALVLIASGSIGGALGIESPVLDLLSDPVVALLLCLVGTCVITRLIAGNKETGKALTKGFQESGQILILTGVGGCLSAVVQAIGLGDILVENLKPGSFAPLLIVWIIAAVLHIAIGSVTTSAITAAGMLAPIAGQLGINPVLVALAAGAGSMFVIHVTSNTFWMLQSLFGLTTRGGLKAVTVGVSVASVVGLFWVLMLSLAI